MLTCRFIANLRDAYLQESTSMGENDCGSAVYFSPPSARFFNSVAGPLSFAGEDSTDDDILSLSHSDPTSISPMLNEGSNLSFWLPLLESTEFLDGGANAERVLLSSAALLYYDFILTLPDEVRLAWRRPRLATVLFLLVRYLALANMALAVIIQTPENPVARLIISDTDCQALVRAALITHILLSAAVSAFVAARIMALWSRNWYLGTILFLAGLLNWSPYVESVLVGFEMVSAPWPLEPCLAWTTRQAPIELVSLYIPAALSAVNLAYEIVCLVLTVIKTIGLYRRPSGLVRQTRLTDLLLRDGSLYFGVMAVLGVLNILSATLPNFTIGSALGEAFSRSLVPMLTCRFIAHLRDAGLQVSTTIGEQDSASTVHFSPPSARLLDSVAGPLDLDDNEYTSDDSGVR
ncbi:uncharacterized protein TRAVEDRAFT_48252 [Trametes versicolor FP-101664 SS1]|uniref:uncharacterized protein n=1 Tax=Trametes versicolor (strain FP-101664) TaxID=717944 RepID=UPI00046212AC|nr:uncharacterized protein TRAVEDRAFT_48252 [Trametes versicolor FP-101664 SS1]EIW57205.1 hypothetical protein TRAVEDRAFT_48252 [Trametes versicolor FP-101664 SS1]